MNIYKKLLPVIAAFIMVSIGGCNKNDDKDDLDGDLTTGISGHYESGSGSGKQDIYITRVDDNTVMVSIDAYENYTFTNAEMTSSSAFTLNSITKGGQGMNYDETDTYTGTGSSSSNTVVVAIHAVRRNTQGTITTEFDMTFNGTK